MNNAIHVQVEVVKLWNLREEREEGVGGGREGEGEERQEGEGGRERARKSKSGSRGGRREGERWEIGGERRLVYQQPERERRAEGRETGERRVVGGGSEGRVRV